MTAPAIIASIAQELRAHEPFSEMPVEQVEAFAVHLRACYFPEGAVILAAGQEVPFVYLVKSGRVVGEREGIAGAAVGALEVDPGEMFPIGAVLTGRPAQSTFRAVRDTLAYRISAENFTHALERMPALQDFSERRLFNLLERSRSTLRAAYAAESLSEQPFAQPLSTTIKHAPIVCQVHDTLETALRTMHEKKVGAIVVVNEEQRAQGIMTERDVIGKIVLQRVGLEQPVLPYASKPVVSLDEAQPMSAAALLMVEKTIRHVVITREEKVVGVISERGLFALQRQSLGGISDAIDSAPDLSALTRGAHDIRELSRTLVAQGVAAGLLTQFISQLNDQLTRRIITLVSEKHPVATSSAVRWCWMAFGSEGRHEQTISTDQDNGIIFDCEAAAVEETRAQLVAFGSEVNRALAACGYPLCMGNIMAGNPELTRTLPEWKARFDRWIDAGDPQSLLNANIYFDFRALVGFHSLVDALSDDVFPRAKTNARFRKQMADAALTNHPPLDWRGRIETDKSNHFDIKRVGAMPFTDGARLLALAAGVSAKRSRDRFTEAGAVLNIPERETQAWTESFEFVQMLRLRHQHDRLNAQEAGKPVPDNPNEIAVAQLSRLDIRILKEAFRQARKLQQRIEMDYS